MATSKLQKYLEAAKNKPAKKPVKKKRNIDAKIQDALNQKLIDMRSFKELNVIIGSQVARDMKRAGFKNQPQMADVQDDVDIYLDDLLSTLLDASRLYLKDKKFALVHSGYGGYSYERKSKNNFGKWEASDGSPVTASMLSILMYYLPGSPEEFDYEAISGGFADDFIDEYVDFEPAEDQAEYEGRYQRGDYPNMKGKRR